MYLEYTGVFDRIRRHYFRKILSRIREDGCRRMLDYGCGPGDVLLLARDEGIEAVGIDSFPRSVSLAEKRGLKVLLGDYNHPDLAEGSFDAILLQSVIEHMPEPVAPLARLAKLLRPGGYLIVSAPTPCADFWNDPTHVRPHTPRSLVTLGELLELEVEEVNYVFSFLLGFRLQAGGWYKLFNLVPFSLGSNLIAFYRRRTDARV